MNVEDGYYYYADQDEDGSIIPSSLIVGRGNPSSIGLELGTVSVPKNMQEKSLLPSKTLYLQIMDQVDAPSSGEISI